MCEQMSKQTTDGQSSDKNPFRNVIATLPALAFWHKLLFAWVVFFVVVGVLGLFIAQAPNATISIVSDKLSDYERHQLGQLLPSVDNKNFHRLKLEEIAQRINDVSWVQSVVVRRDWRQGIVVEPTPRAAVANFGSEHLLDVKGVVFTPSDTNLLNNPKFINLYGNEQNALEIMKQMERVSRWYTPLGLSVQDVILTDRQTLIVRFDTGLRVVADYDRVDQKLYQLAGILKENTLPIPLDRIQAIDLRYKNGFSITDTTAVAQTQ